MTRKIQGVRDWRVDELVAMRYGKEYLVYKCINVDSPGILNIPTGWGYFRQVLTGSGSKANPKGTVRFNTQWLGYNYILLEDYIKKLEDKANLYKEFFMEHYGSKQV